MTEANPTFQLTERQKQIIIDKLCAQNESIDYNIQSLKEFYAINYFIINLLLGKVS